jgi:hypothetical protein
MLTLIREETNKNYSRSMAVWEVDDETLGRARDIFNDYKARGVIISGEFEDMSWTLSDQAKSVGLALLTFEGGFHKKALEWIGCSYRQYVDSVKAYIVLNLGELGLATLQELVRVFNRLVVASHEEACVDSVNLSHIIALLQIIPGGNAQRDCVIEGLEEKVEQLSRKKNKGCQRQLADFASYLRFNEVLESFWQNADEGQKLFYFPLYFWWNLTAILPLRPMELLLTPRNCLRVNNGDNILTVRRTKLKGGVCKISYRISEDYDLKEYAIHGCLANELAHYINTTENMRQPEIDTLFSQEPHFRYLNRTGYSSNRYYTYQILATALRYFYQESGCGLDSGISRIRLGDTRHLAMTNLIISGGSPVICRELADHSSIDISAHYYANISNLVECMTLERYRKSKGATADITGMAKYPITISLDKCRVSGGWCSSDAMKAGNIDDCLKIMDGNGHIGVCRACSQYQPDNPGIHLAFLDEASGKAQVDADSRHLIRMIELVRRGLGYEEDIGSALLRLQRSSNHYGKCLWEKYTMEDRIDGKTAKTGNG